MRVVTGWLIRAATLGWLAGHFASTALFTLPLNPLKMVTIRPLNASIGRFFPQNWSLFAPNPISRDQSLLARCLRDEEQDVPNDSLPTDRWYDLSMPLWHRFQQNRFSAYDRLARPHTYALREYVGGGLALQPWLESCQKGLQKSCDAYQEGLERTRKAARRMLGRVASAFCEDIGPPGAYAAVALRLRDTPALPWSRRYERERPHADVEVIRVPIERGVATTGLYRAERLP